MKEGPVFSQGMPVLAAEILALLQRVPEMGANAGKRSGDGSCESGLEVRLGYLDSGDSTFVGFGYRQSAHTHYWRSRS